MSCLVLYLYFLGFTDILRIHGCGTRRVTDADDVADCPLFQVLRYSVKKKNWKRKCKCRKFIPPYESVFDERHFFYRFCGDF